MAIRNIYDSLCGMHPSVEVLSRKLYWNNNYLIRKYNEKKNEIKEPSLKFPLLEIINTIYSLGIGEGCILLIHSSYENIQRNCSDLIKPKELIEMLAGLIGNAGTLAFPTHPSYSREKISKDTIRSNDDVKEVLTYDVRKTLAWTGFLPNVFLRIKSYKE